MSNNSKKISSKEIKARELNYELYLSSEFLYLNKFYDDYRFLITNQIKLAIKYSLINGHRLNANEIEELKQFRKDESQFYKDYKQERKDFLDDLRLLYIRNRVKYLYSVEESDDYLVDYKEWIYEHCYYYFSLYKEFSDVLEKLGLDKVFSDVLEKLGLDTPLNN